APVVGGALDALEGLVAVGGRRMLVPELLARRVQRARPREGRVGALTGAQRGRRVRARALEPDPQVGDQAQWYVVGAAGRGGLAVARARVLPLRGRPAVVEDGVAVEAQLDAADDALRRAQEDVLGLVVGRRPAVGAGPALLVVPGA